MKLTLLFAAALVVAGAGCMNVDGSIDPKSDPNGDPSSASTNPSSASTVPSSLASAAPVILVGHDALHRTPYVVLDANADDTATEAGATTWRDAIDSYTYVARKELSKEALVSFASVAGTRVVLHDLTGHRCGAALGKPFLLGRTQDDLTLENAGEEKHVPTDEEIWDATSGGRALVAPLVGDACVRSTSDDAWAIASASDVTPLPMKDADGPATRKLLAAYRALPEWGAIDKRWKEWGATVDPSAGKTSWDAFNGGEPRVTVTSIDGARTAWVSFTTGGGCGDFSGQLTARFVERDGLWVVEETRDDVFDTPTIGWKTPSGIAWSFSEGVVRDETLVSPMIAYHGCPC